MRGRFPHEGGATPTLQPTRQDDSLRSLLSGITPADIRLDPYPHVFVRDVLDEDTHRALNDGFPAFSMMGWADTKRLPGSNQRFQLSTWPMLNNPDMPDVWKEFVTLHASPAFFAEVVALFRDHWPAALKQALGGDLLAHYRARRGWAGINTQVQRSKDNLSHPPPAAKGVASRPAGCIVLQA